MEEEEEERRRGFDEEEEETTIAEEEKLKLKKVARKYEIIGTTLDPEVNSRFPFSVINASLHFSHDSSSPSIVFLLFLCPSLAKNLIYRSSLQSITCLSW